MFVVEREYGSLVGAPVVVRNTFDYEMEKGVVEESPYTGHETFRAGAFTVDFYIAGAPAEKPEEVLAVAKARVGKSADPMGDALSSAAPPQHLALVKHGELVTTIQLANRVFDAARAKELVTAIVGAWR